MRSTQMMLCWGLPLNDTEARSLKVSGAPSTHPSLPSILVSSIAVQPEDLHRLLVRLCMQPLPQLPELAPPKSGQFQLKGIHFADLSARIILDQQNGSLQLSGNDHQTGWKLMNCATNAVAYELINNATDLELADGSQIHAESIFPVQLASRWLCRIDRWLWWLHEKVRFWIGSSTEATLSPARNLQVINGSDFWSGIHIPGWESVPSVTLLNNASNERFNKSVTVVVEALGDVDWARNRLPNVATILRAALGLPVPSFFLGVDDQGAVCAAISWAPNPADRNWSLMPLSCIGSHNLLVPSDYGTRLVWIAPLLTHLMEDSFRPVNRTIAALELFRLSLSEEVGHDQLAKIARAIRVLVRRNHTQSDLADYLTPESCWDRVHAFAQARRIIMPDGSKEAFCLAHQLALIGDYGLYEQKYGKPDIEDHNRLLRAVETLRTTFASLLVGLIGYHGPISWRLSNDRLKIELHQATQAAEGGDCNSDEILASKRFFARYDNSIS